MIEAPETIERTHSPPPLPADADRQLRNGTAPIRLSCTHLGRAAYRTWGIHDERMAEGAAYWLAQEVFDTFLAAWREEADKEARDGCE